MLGSGGIGRSDDLEVGGKDIKVMMELRAEDDNIHSWNIPHLLSSENPYFILIHLYFLLAFSPEYLQLGQQRTALPTNPE